MRYLLKSGKNPVKIVRQEGALVRRSVWRRRLGAIISVVASGLLATVVTVISTRQEVNLANVEAKQARQREAFTEAWAASELHALEVDRMRRISGLYLLATRLLEANSDNPIAKMFVAEGRAQSLAISTAFKQAESSLAKHQLLLAEEQRYLLRSIWRPMKGSSVRCSPWNDARSPIGSEMRLDFKHSSGTRPG